MMPPKKTQAPATPPCHECGEPAEVAISQSEKNPQRPYWRCTNCKTEKGPMFLGWHGEYTGEKPQFKRGGGTPYKKPQKTSWDQEEEEEEERPKKSLKRAADDIPTGPPSNMNFLDKYTKDKILQSHDLGIRAVTLLQELHAKVDYLIHDYEAGIRDKDGPLAIDDQ